MQSWCKCIGNAMYLTDHSKHVFECKLFTLAFTGHADVAQSNMVHLDIVRRAE